MDQELAERILKGALSLDSGFSELDSAISSIPDDTERKELAKKLADIIGHVNDAIIRPIVRQYPKLDPNPL